MSKTANYTPYPGCMCGHCGDADNRPRPHNLASVGTRPHVTEDVFEFVRFNRRFTLQELEDAVGPRWAVANGFAPFLQRLRQRGLIDFRFDRSERVYVVLVVAGEVVQ